LKTKIILLTSTITIKKAVYSTAFLLYRIESSAEKYNISKKLERSIICQIGAVLHMHLKVGG